MKFKRPNPILPTSKMKICLVSDYLVGYHQTWSGAEMVCLRLAELLKKENQEVVFITTRFKKKNLSKEVFQIPISPSKNQFLRKISAPFYFILGIIFAIWYLKKIKPDILHFLHSNYLFTPVMISARLLGLPTVFTVLDYFIICPRSTFRLTSGKICNKLEGFHCLKCVSILKLLERFITRLLSKNLKGIIAFTQTSKSRLVKHRFHPEKIKVIYTYNLPRKFITENKTKTFGTNPNTILFVGSFHKHKGLDILIQAMSQIVVEVPRARVIVVGTGPESERARIENIVTNLKLGDYIKFLGQKNNEETLRLVLKSEVVVVPEQWLSDFGPLILVEAMALGKPVVASKIGSIPEFIKDSLNGFLADYNRPEQFAEKIIWFLENKEKAKEMGRRAKESIQSLVEKDQVKEILKLYQGL